MSSCAAARKEEQVRVAQMLSVAANELCSCGGRPADAPDACPVCLYYHRVLDLLGIECQFAP
jgi:hypothetical protein